MTTSYKEWAERNPDFAADMPEVIFYLHRVRARLVHLQLLDVVAELDRAIELSWPPRDAPVQCVHCQTTHPISRGPSNRSSKAACER